jgi:hypothetical protein
MDSFVKADVFFFITGLAVFFVTVGLLLIIFYVLRIIKELHKIVSLVRVNLEGFDRDISFFKENVIKKGVAVSSMLSWLREKISSSTRKKGRGKK